MASTLAAFDLLSILALHPSRPVFCRLVAMPEYRRLFVPGSMYFFTVVTHRRRPLFQLPLARRLLNRAIQDTRSRHPFAIDAMVLLHDHLHTIWTLPPDDHDFPVRWRRIKEGFTRAFAATGTRELRVGTGAQHKGIRGFWQQRYWEHRIRDEADLHRHLDYIHFNPVKHRLARCPHAWPYSSFRRYVRSGAYPADWGCTCDGRSNRTPDMNDLTGNAGE